MPSELGRVYTGDSSGSQPRENSETRSDEGGHTLKPGIEGDPKTLRKLWRRLIFFAFHSNQKRIPPKDPPNLTIDWKKRFIEPIRMGSGASQLLSGAKKTPSPPLGADRDRHTEETPGITRSQKTTGRSMAKAGATSSGHESPQKKVVDVHQGGSGEIPHLRAKALSLAFNFIHLLGFDGSPSL